MRRILFLIFLIVFNIGAVHVKGYWRKDGTYVKPHYRTRANRTVTDNYIYKGNVNSYTGAVGAYSAQSGRSFRFIPAGINQTKILT